MKTEKELSNWEIKKRECTSFGCGKTEHAVFNYKQVWNKGFRSEEIIDMAYYFCLSCEKHATELSEEELSAIRGGK